MPKRSRSEAELVEEPADDTWLLVGEAGARLVAAELNEGDPAEVIAALQARTALKFAGAEALPALLELCPGFLFRVQKHRSRGHSLTHSLSLSLAAPTWWR